MKKFRWFRKSIFSRIGFQAVRTHESLPTALELKRVLWAFKIFFRMHDAIPITTNGIPKTGLRGKTTNNNKGIITTNGKIKNKGIITTNGFIGQNGFNIRGWRNFLKSDLMSHSLFKLLLNPLTTGKGPFGPTSILTLWEIEIADIFRQYEK